MKKILLVLLVVVLILSACKVPAETQDSTQAPELSAEIQVTSKLLRVSGRSEDEMISDMNTLGENLQKDVFLNDDGIVTVRFAETEREDWKHQVASRAEDLSQRYTGEFGGNYKLLFADDLNTFDIYATGEMDQPRLIYYVIFGETLCAYYQLFSGVGSEEWYVEINFYNADSGHFIVQGNSNAPLTITSEDWEASK